MVMLPIRSDELDRLIENRVDLDLAIDSSDDWNRLSDLYALRAANERAIDRWLADAEVCGYA
jgi:hypothetical protein